MRLLMYVFIMRATIKLVVIFFSVYCTAHIAAYRAYLFARLTVLSACYRTHFIISLSMLYLQARLKTQVRLWTWRFQYLKWKLFNKEGSEEL